MLPSCGSCSRVWPTIHDTTDSGLSREPRRGHQPPGLLLTKDGINVNFDGDLHGETHISDLTNRGLEEVVKSLLDGDLDPNIVNDRGTMYYKAR